MRDVNEELVVVRVIIIQEAIAALSGAIAALGEVAILTHAKWLLESALEAPND